LETKYENDWVTVYATDAVEAAEKFCEDHDPGGDYDILKRGSEEIQVRKLGEEKIVVVSITAESRAHYYGEINE